ncbi:8-amino-7-oxononanoate synthase [Rhodocytophaga aerolata]|uniref:8-amino-7-oxononanoate synthase n=1 Tax=Rhodocytophaga aerolata TaxID=455078 RepID=A0ABT8R869_9BACT|nr:8-amino-7-oxononanoate synthase [Rhodocytophaga aerolata]MDO1448293.1 8-amino-7-oxononanoate synthase [Rhodocytophaga aerolata]
MWSIEEKLALRLQERVSQNNLRELPIVQKKIDFCSNDYLGLASNAALAQQIQQTYAQLPFLQNGSTGSRLISGNSLYAMELEEALATTFQAEKALLFNSGYSANTAILSAIPQKGDTIVYDEYIHASLKEGARLSFASRYPFRHNDLEDLEKKLGKATGEKFVVAESVYSMDGDVAPLEEILRICRKYNAHLIWDEAHSTGVWGENGNGIACTQQLQNQIFARIYTFGKAMGVHGACIAGSAVLIDYLVNFARPFIYTTALPLHSLVSIREAFKFLQANTYLQHTLYTRIAAFAAELMKYPSLQTRWIKSESAIQAIKIGGNALTKTIASQLQTADYDVRAILSPTVKEGEERLRICLHVYNTEEEIRNLVEYLTHVFMQTTAGFAASSG